MNTFFKRLSRKVPLFLALFFASFSFIAALPTRQVAAANTVNLPLVWTANNHEYAVSDNNVVFRPLGHVCAAQAGGSSGIFKGSGTNVSIGDDGKPDDDKVDVPKDTEAGSGADTREVPSCNANAGSIPASYAWVTSFKDGTNFALIVNGTGKGGVDNKVDAQYKPIGGGNSTYAAVYQITGAGGIANQRAVDAMKVDTSKAKYVDKDASGDEKGDDTVSDDTCPIKDNWALRLFACPLVTAAETAILKLEEFVTSMLVSDVKDIFGSSSASGDLDQSKNAQAYYQAWNSFRIIAVALIIIFAIIMVVSEATGLAIFDAYTIRKMLPRLLIAAILISLSWWLMKYAVQFFNNLTVWLAGALSFPFQSVMKGNDSPWSIVGQWTVIIAASLALGPFGILSYAGTIFLALIVAVFALIVRRILLILAIIMAAPFILLLMWPNTKKIGTFWSSGFVGLLIMGPAFTLMVEAGQILSKVSAGKDTFGLISFAALVLPVLGIPVLFTKIGGSAAGLIGFANNKAAGGFDRLKNFRKGQVQQRGQRAKEGNLFGAGAVRGGAAEKLNKFTSKAALGAKGNFGMGMKGNEAYEQRMAVMAAAHAKSEAGQAGQFNDNMNRVLSYGSEREARANAMQDWGMDEQTLDTSIAAAKANGGFGIARARNAAQALSATGTGYDNLEQVTKTIARVAGNNKSVGAALAGGINSSTKQAGRHDLAPGFGKLNELVGQQMDSNNRTVIARENAAGQMLDSNDNVVTDKKLQAMDLVTSPDAGAYRKATIQAFEGVDMASLARNKTKSVSNISEAIHQTLTERQTDLETAQRSGDTSRIHTAEANVNKLVAQIKNLEGSGLYAPAANVQAVQENIIQRDRGTVDVATGQRTGQNIIQNVTSSVQPRVQQDVTYQINRDAGGNVTHLTQDVKSNTTPPRASPNAQDAFNAYNNSRNFRRDDENINTP